jgi:hypothetical protein
MRTSLVRRSVAVLLSALLLVPTAASAEIVIRLDNTFIEKFKNRATIDVDFTVDKAHHSPKTPSPKKPSNDGDIHVAGRAPQIKLPTIAELMNAKLDPDAIKTIVAAEGTGTPIRLNGVWRLWCEHAGATDQIQGDPLEPFTNTNPDHCFEVHPLVEVEGRSVRDTFQAIEGFKNKDAEDAFDRYENIRTELKVANGKTTIFTNAVGFNYVEFIMELQEDPTFESEDALFVRSNVQDLHDELLVRNRRMVFVKGTAAEQMVRPMKKGDRLRVLGIPRVNFAILSWRIRNRATRPEVLQWNLPVEIVILHGYEVLPPID